MKSILRKSVVALLIIIMTLSCFPYQVFAANDFALQDTFKFKGINDSAPVNGKTDFPEVEFEIFEVFNYAESDEYEVSLGTATTDNTGVLTYSHNIDLSDKILSYSLVEGQPYELIFPDENDVFWSANNNVVFVVDYRQNNTSLMDAHKFGAYIREMRGNATITKTQKGNATVVVPNAEYEITYIDHKGTRTVVGTETTNGNGQINLTNILCGKYEIKEIASPEGYRINTTAYPFTVLESNTSPVFVEDELLTTVILTKTDKATGEKLSGVTFELFNKNNTTTPIKTFTTNEDGQIKVEGLANGKYYFTEKQAKENYEPNTESYEFEINGTEKEISINVTNTKWSYITFKKVDAEDENIMLNGAIIEIYKAEDANGLDIKEGATPVYTSTGESTFSLYLDDGDYIYVEKQSPTNYKKTSNKKFTVELEKDDTINIPNEKHKISIKVSKYDSETKELLSGASFKLTGPVNKTWLSNDENAEIIKDLIPGTYKLEEIGIPNGYIGSGDIDIIIGTDCKKVEMTCGGVTKDITTSDMTTIMPEIKVENTPIHLTINKVDNETNNQISNVVFDIYELDTQNNKTFVLSFTTGQDPYFNRTFKAGRYLLVERTTPDTYTKDTTKVTANKGNLNPEITPDGIIFTIGNDSENALTVYNNRVYGSITIKKYGKKFNNITNGAPTLSDNVPLAGAKFVIKAKEDILDPSGNGVIIYKAHDVVYEGETPLNGELIVNNLPFGIYEIFETEAPNGYIKQEQIEDVEIKSQNLNVTRLVYNDNETLNIVIEKVDAENDAIKLPNAVYGIYLLPENNATQEVLIETVTTDNNGKATFSAKVPKGKYLVKELTAPKGYILSNEEKIVDFSGKTTENSPLVFKNEKIILTIKKVDEKTGDYVVGAHLALYDVNDMTKPYIEWDTTLDAFIIEGIPEGEYVIKETVTPIGYVSSSNLGSFRVEQSKDNKITVTNKRALGTIVINKTEEVTNNPIENVGFRLIDGDTKGQVVYTNKYGQLIFDNLEIGIYENGVMTRFKTYKVEEVSVPKLGYIIPKNNVVDVSFSADDIKNSGEIKRTISIKNDYTKLKIHKVDITGNFPVIGTVFKLYNRIDANDDLSIKDGAQPVLEWTVTDAPYIVERELPIGTYVLTEIPYDGYIKCENKEIVISDGSWVEHTIKNDYTKISIQKVDAETGEGLEGAKLQLLDASNNVVKEWISTKEPFEIDRLPVGIYTLIEKEAPKGYILNETKKSIEVLEQTERKAYTFDNTLDAYDIIFSKIENVTENELPGATLAIKNEKGEIVKQWVSGNNPITYRLLPGKYTYVELNAPEGYSIASEIPFELLPNKATDISKIKMTNSKTETHISKIKKGTDKFVVGAKLHIEDKDGKIIEKWESTDEAHIIYGLPVGIYKIVEDTAPNGYLLMEAKEFEVCDDGKIIEVVVENEFIEELPDSPQTGDRSNVMVYFFTMIISLAGITLLIIKRKI